MQITTSSGTMFLDPTSRPSTDDMNDIISSLTSDPVEFQAICDASVSFPCETCEELYDACIDFAMDAFGDTENPA